MGCLDIRCGEPPLAGRRQFDLHRLQPQPAERVEVGGVAGPRHRDSGVALKSAEKGKNEGRRRPHRDHDVLGVNRDAVELAIVKRERIAEARQSLGRGVGLAGWQGTGYRFEHCRRGRRRRLPQLEMADRLAARFQHLGARQDFQGVEGFKSGRMAVVHDAVSCGRLAYRSAQLSILNGK